MTFYRDEVMPLLFDGPAFEAGKRLNWQHMVESFEKPGAAYCNLARNSAAAAIVAPSTELARQTLPVPGSWHQVAAGGHKNRECCAEPENVTTNFCVSDLGSNLHYSN